MYSVILYCCMLLSVVVVRRVYNMLFFFVISVALCPSVVPCWFLVAFVVHFLLWFVFCYSLFYYRFNIQLYKRCYKNINIILPFSCVFTLYDPLPSPMNTFPIIIILHTTTRLWFTEREDIVHRQYNLIFNFRDPAQETEFRSNTQSVQSSK